MTLARSKVTAQGQISVPAEVRRRLGVRPGSVLEWHEEERKIVVRRSGHSDWDDVLRALFPDGPPKPRALGELKQTIRRYVSKRHARH
ncbi:MAG TPA: AbrB/MazE/SpoVT family DNA-binding domain-containing protein [Terriglobia bacterium]|nr:AbrB/MazE/SpoVT family DNA-binding domain-containing protein [Terriglobia bacterium]